MNPLLILKIINKKTFSISLIFKGATFQPMTMQTIFPCPCLFLNKIFSSNHFSHLVPDMPIDHRCSNPEFYTPRDRTKFAKKKNHQH